MKNSERHTIEFANVSCIIGRTSILQDITLNISSGDITGILGPNGAGKSTLLSLLNGLRTQSAGDIKIFDIPVSKGSNPYKKDTGVVLQYNALYEELTVLENLNFSATLYNIEKPLARIIETLNLLSLSDRADQKIKELSGGLKRRVAIARALIHNPQLLIVDEPTLGVDAEARHIIWEHMRLLKTKGCTIVVATNYLDEAQALCDRIAILRKGKIQGVETPSTLIKRAGYCIDFECPTKDIEIITKVISKDKAVIRIQPTSTGVSIFFKELSAQEEIISKVLKHANIKNLRTRSPDLAEIFNSFE